jgi:hypothetical protein
MNFIRNHQRIAGGLAIISTVVFLISGVLALGIAYKSGPESGAGEKNPINRIFKNLGGKTVDYKMLGAFNSGGGEASLIEKGQIKFPEKEGFSTSKVGPTWGDTKVVQGEVYIKQDGRDWEKIPKGENWGVSASYSPLSWFMDLVLHSDANLLINQKKVGYKTLMSINTIRYTSQIDKFKEEKLSSQKIESLEGPQRAQAELDKAAGTRWNPEGTIDVFVDATSGSLPVSIVLYDEGRKLSSGEPTNYSIMLKFTRNSKGS